MSQPQQETNKQKKRLCIYSLSAAFLACSGMIAGYPAMKDTLSGSPKYALVNECFNKATRVCTPEEYTTAYVISKSASGSMTLGMASLMLYGFSFPGRNRKEKTL